MNFKSTFALKSLKGLRNLNSLVNMLWMKGFLGLREAGKQNKANRQTNH